MARARVPPRRGPGARSGLFAPLSLDQMQGICELLDAGDASKPYSAALAFQRAKLADFAELPSARLLDEMRRQGRSFFEVALWMSEMHRDYFRELYPRNPGRLALDTS